MAITENCTGVHSPSPAGNIIPDLWQPQWLVEIDETTIMGIALDDGCYVALNQMPTGNWKPSTHIPVEAARMIGRLAGG